MSNLKDQLIKLGSENPDLQNHLRPVLDKIAAYDNMKAGEWIFENVLEYLKDQGIEVLDRKKTGDTVANCLYKSSDGEEYKFNVSMSMRRKLIKVQDPRMRAENWERELEMNLAQNIGWYQVRAMKFVREMFEDL